MASAPGIDEMFGKILEAHRDVPPAVALVSILDPSFAVQRSALDAPFCSEILTRLSPKPKVCCVPVTTALVVGDCM